MWLYEAPQQLDPKQKETAGFQFSGDEDVGEPLKPVLTIAETHKNKIEAKPQNSVHKRTIKPLLNCLPYFIGLATSGAFFSLCSVSQRQLLLHYGESWISSFAGKPVQLFSTLFLPAVLLLTLLLLLGFCTFGRPLSRIVLFLYGIGSGVLCLQMLVLYGWRGWVFYGLVPGFYSAVLAWFLCRFSSFSMQLSTALKKLLSKKENPPAYGVTAKALVEKYLVLCSLQVLSCSIFALLAKPISGYLL